MKNTKIAIACQGGGSQTAFTAGVLKAFFENDLHHKREIVSLSGTSGGAICALLAWYGLLKAAQGDPTPIQDRIMGFWKELAARLFPELILGGFVEGWLRLLDKGLFPHYEISPASPFAQQTLALIGSMLPRPEFTDLKALLEKHVPFDEIPKLTGPASPVLLLGAAEVLTGELKKFNSREGEITVAAVLASAAVPTLFPAVQIGTNYYWDGLFSDNPPIKELIRARYVGGDKVPDEIWIIQINPTRCSKVPETTAEIIDRRNQMIGNVSLLQSVEFVEMINIFLERKALTDEALNSVGISKRDPFKIHFIRMSEDLQGSLDYVSKLTREVPHIERLHRDGEKQGLAFLRQHGL